MNRTQAAAAAVLALMLAGCDSAAEKAGGQTQVKKVPNVSAEQVAVRDMVERIVLPGTISPDEAVLVSAEVGGLVERIVPEKGDRVRKGDVLAEIARSTSKASLDQAEAALQQARVGKAEAELGVRRAEAAEEGARIGIQQAKAALEAAGKAREKAEAALQNQRAQYERVRKLFDERLASNAAMDDARTALTALEADAAGATSQVTSATEAVALAENGLKNAQLAREAARLRVNAAGAEIAAAEAAVAQARLHWEKGLLTASFDGAVDDIYFEEGEFVKGESAVLRLIRMNPAKVEISLAEKDIPFVRAGVEAAVTVPSLPDEPFAGRVSFVALSADPATTTYRAELRVANPAGRLRAGMVAQVTLVRMTAPGAVGVPAFAVIPKEDGDVVFVLEDSKAVRRKVTTGILENGWVQVTSGLTPGERLIVKGHRDLQDGQEVRLP